jgi:hypothetical protein
MYVQYSSCGRSTTEMTDIFNCACISIKFELKMTILLQ